MHNNHLKCQKSHVITNKYVSWSSSQNQSNFQSMSTWSTYGLSQKISLELDPIKNSIYLFSICPSWQQALSFDFSRCVLPNDMLFHFPFQHVSFLMTHFIIFYFRMCPSWLCFIIFLFRMCPWWQELSNYQIVKQTNNWQTHWMDDDFIGLFCLIFLWIFLLVHVISYLKDVP